MQFYQDTMKRKRSEMQFFIINQFRNTLHSIATILTKYYVTYTIMTLATHAFA